MFSFCSFFCFCCFFSRSCSLIQTTVITTASTNAVIATSTYPPTPSCNRIAPYIPAASIGWICTVPQGTKTAENTEQTGDRLYAAPFGGDIHTFAFLPAQHAFLYRTYFPTSSKAQLKKPFTYIGTKTRRNSHLKIEFFQKIWELHKSNSQRRKIQLYHGMRRREISFPTVKIRTGRR